MTWIDRLLFFPLKSRSKEPATAHGHLDAKPIGAWTCEASNWGIRCGPDSGITVIDIDPRNGGSLDALPSSVLSAPRVKTGGGGWHLYFQSVPPGSRFVRLPGIDFKANGYVVAPGSIHPSGALYEWEQEGELPPFPTELLDATPLLLSDDAPGILPDDIVDMLEAIPSEDRKIWVDIGMALHSVAPGMEGFELWHDWSKKASSYKGLADCNRVWNSFGKKDGITPGTLVAYARDHGYRRQPVDMSGQFAPRPRPTVTDPETPSFTPRLPVPVLEEIRRWAEPSCDPVAAVAVALTLGSLKVARQVRSDKGDLPVLYFSLIGPSAVSGIGAGDAVEQALRDAHLGWMLRGGSLASEEKLKRAFLRSATLFHFTHAWASQVQFSYRQPSGALASAHRVIDRVYRGSTLYHEDEKRPDEEPVVLFSPHLALLTSVGVDELPKILTSDEMGRGAHESFLSVPLRSPGDRPTGSLPGDIACWLGGEVLASSLAPDAGKPPAWTTLSIRSPEGVSDDPVYRGSVAIARRIALVLAACDDPFAVSVPDDFVSWAMSFVDYCARTVKPEDSASGDGKTTPYDYVLAYAKKRGKAGFTPRDLVQGVKPFRNLKAEERTRLVDLMTEDGVLVSVAQRGRKGERLFHRDFVRVEGGAS